VTSRETFIPAAGVKNRAGGLQRAACSLAMVLFAVGLRAQPEVATVISNGLNEPSYITSDLSNNIYFTDASFNRIVEFVPGTNGVLTLAGSGTPQQYQYSNSIYGGQAQFFQPEGIVYDSYRGGLVVVDQGNSVLRFVTLGGAVSTLAGVPPTTFSRNGGSSDGTATTAQFSFPVGIASDGAGNLYVADTGNNVIRRVNSTNGVDTVQVTNYAFRGPAAVALDNGDNLWVADTQHHTICIISNISVIANQSAYVIAGTPGTSGTNDSIFAGNALFNKPSGLLWDPNGAGLIIGDTGNNALRRLYPNTVLGGLSVETVAGLSGTPGGNVDGTVSGARLNAPLGIAVDVLDNGYYFMDRGNSELRRYQTGPPLPAVQDPQIGLVTFPIDSQTSTAFSHFTPLPQGGIFYTNNVVSIYNPDSDPNVQTFYILTNTPANQFLNTPVPTADSHQAFNYPGDGYPATTQDSSSLFQPQPTPMTLYARSLARGRAPSHVVSAQFQYICAPPTIGGNNGAQVQLTELTTPATLWYTLDGSTPSNGPPSIGPVTPTTNISFNVVSNVTLSVQAFAPNFAPSAVVVEEFTASNFFGNQITFGFANNEASSAFIGSAGHRFYAPVTLSLLPAATMYSLQFNAVVTNNPGAPAVGQTYTFDSMLVKPVQVNGATFYQTIPPALVDLANSNFVNGVFTNSSIDLLGVGWYEIPPETNLYNATAQDLITYSLPHETLFLSSAGSVVLGSYSFVIPAAAALGSSYQIQLGRPSADGNGFTQNVLIQTPTNGSLGQGAVNSIKNVTVGVVPYLVGDVAPFRWFNAGDFGDSNLLDNDVLDTFRAAVYQLNRPLHGSDFFDAMDSSDGADPNYLNGNDTAINNIMFGDGVLDVSDVYVTFRRSLDHTLTDYQRYWSNGTLHARAVPNIYNQGNVAISSKRLHPQLTTPTVQHSISVAADRVLGSAGQTVTIPVRVVVADSLPITVLAVNVDIVPLDGSPPIVTPVSFSAASGLGASFATLSQSANNFAGAWLNSTNTGVVGTNSIGTVYVTLPAGANANSSYLVHFEHFSASPNGIGVFPATVQDGLITGADRSASSWNDGIPDWWRLLCFGTVSNLLSSANLDADGDGASNWQEYVAGTNPMDPTSVLQLTPMPPAGPFTVQWPSVVGKTYMVQCSSCLFSTNWATVVSNLSGTGQMMQLSDPATSPPPVRFYRVQVQ